MSSRRTAILIGAIAIGIVAVLLIVQYVHGIENGVNQNQELVPVFIAKIDIKRGTDGSQSVTDQSIEQTQIPRKFYPSTAIQSTDAVQKKVALFDIAAGTMIVNNMFVDPSTNVISFRQRLSSPKHVAITISTDQIHGVGGFLVPGDEVNMMILQDNGGIKAAVNTPSDASQSVANINGGKELNSKIEAKDSKNFISVGGPQWMVIGSTARYLYQKVKIIAVGSNQLLTPGEQAQTPAAGQAAGGNSGALTLEVPPEAAQYIASTTGYYLTLVPKDYKPDPLLHPLPVVIDTLPGEDPTRLCPYWDTTSGPAETREKGCTG